MSPDALTDCLDHFRASAARLETLPRYSDAGDTALRSVHSNRYLARIARAALAGRIWTRIRVVDDPLTTYQREQLTRSYLESHACGEDVIVVDRALVQPNLTDVWVFDAWYHGARAVRLHFDGDGTPLPDRDELITDPEQVDELGHDLHQLAEIGTPLDDYLRELARSGR